MIKNMIFLENDTVSVIKCNHSGKLEFIKKKGEKKYPISNDFWDWWKRVTSYIESDELDICFIYDKEYDLLNDNFFSNANKIEESASMWDLEYIKCFFHEIEKRNSNVHLIMGDGTEEKLQSFVSDKVEKFYTNVKDSLKYKKENSKNENSTKVRESCEIGEIAQYFIDLMRNENQA